MDISDPNNFDVNDIIIPEYTAPPFDQLYDSDEEFVEMTDIDENKDMLLLEKEEVYHN